MDFAYPAFLMLCATCTSRTGVAPVHPYDQQLSFSQPVRIYPQGKPSTCSECGGLYADAFYSVGGGGGGASGGFLFGTPGIVPNTKTMLSTDAGQSWTGWYGASNYVDPKTGYPFTAVTNGSVSSSDLLVHVAAAGTCVLHLSANRHLASCVRRY